MSITPALQLLFPHLMDIGVLHLLRQHYLLLVLLVHKMQNGFKTSNLYAVCVTQFSSSNTPPILARKQVKASD